MSGPQTGSFADPGAPVAARVADLLGRLTLDEKIALLHQQQAAVPRLGIGAFRTGTEALHGLAWLGPATVFPQAVGLAASWDPELVRTVGTAVGEEVRGFHHKDPGRAGLNVWAPVVNPLRDPRWGRNEEGYAEDPWLTGVMGTAYAGGLRGDHPTYLRTAPTLKHFLAYNNETDRSTTSSNLPPRVLHEYDLPAFRAPIAAGAAVAVMASYNLVNGRPTHLSPLINDELRRWTADDVLVVGDADGVGNIAGSQAYHPDHPSAFAAALRAGIDSYTEDGADPGPTVARVTEALRRGLLTESDVDRAVGRALSIRFRLGEFDPPERNPYAHTTADVVNCAAHQELARRAARRSIVLLRTDGDLLPLRAERDRRVAIIGPLADTLFEDWYSGTLPYAVTAYGGIAERLGADRAVYREGVDRVLLRCAETGRYVRAVDAPDGGPVLLGGDAPTPDCWFDIFDWGAEVHALRAAANGRHVGVDADGTLVNDQPGPNGWFVRETFRLHRHADGTASLHHLAGDRHVGVAADGTLRADVAEPAAAARFALEVVTDGLQAAAAAARDADVAVVVLGNHPMVNGRETQDRVDLALPAAQDALLRAVHAANPRTVLVLTSSYPYAVTWADEHLPAVLWSAHGGQEYGHALADVLFGAGPGGAAVDAVGRLTQTWYADTAELPDLLDYDIIGTEATYLYYRGTPLYPFGHGLSYTRFEYEDLRLDAAEVGPDGAVTVRVDVVNAGDRPGEEVVQLYTRQRRSRVRQPLRQLRDFRRVRLAPGERTTVELLLPAAELAFWDVTRGRPVVEDARHTIAVGSSSTNLRLTTTLTVRGERIPPRDARGGPVRAADADDYAGVDIVPATPERGDALRSAYAGAWLVFAGVDLGSGGPLTADPGTAGVTVRLDDPRTGPAAGTGVRDVYLCFDAADVTVDTVRFRAAGGGAE
ncbi:MAG TPA: glycoside hydrolase family 3 C-terminal domain-containing protein [Pilimelia sp.]|nr:glycoside hydrolase family 3 C-terminal domain-containing protein [Pilimelia sp.]